MPPYLFAVKKRRAGIDSHDSLEGKRISKKSRKGNSTKKAASKNAAALGSSGLLDSNQRPHAPQTRALPTALNPVSECKGTNFKGTNLF